VVRRNYCQFVTLLRFLGKLYSPFAASVNSSAILNDPLKPFTLKRLSGTRWVLKLPLQTLKYKNAHVHVLLTALVEKKAKHNSDIAR
jgi:hypothetical protein